jgi:signal transduction histidine kinase
VAEAVGRDPATAATLPRLAALVRLLLQLRLMLTAIALLLMPSERLILPTAIGVVAFALLSGLAARYWERFVPYLVNHPLLITLDVVVASGILGIDGPTGAVFLTTVLTSTICGVLFGLRGVIAVAGVQILCYALAVVSYAGVHPDAVAEQLLTFQVLVVHPVLYPIAGYVGMRVRGIFTELAAEQDARRQAERAAAAAEERDRLARDMHDSVAKTLRGAAMAAQALPVWLAKDPERAAATAAQVADAAETAAAEARALISDLRDGSAVVPFGRAVRDIAAAWSAETGIPVTVEESGEVRLLVTARQEGTAILKEALTNIERHADAGAVTIAVTAGPGHCTLVVADDGVGFTRPPEQVREAERRGNGHYGLLGMAERAERAGGTLEVTSTPGAGSRLLLRVPAATDAPGAASEGALR